MRNRLRASHSFLLPTVIRAVNGNLANNFLHFLVMMLMGWVTVQQPMLNVFKKGLCQENTNEDPFLVLHSEHSLGLLIPRPVGFALRN